MRCNKPVVISCNKQWREIATVHNIAYKQIGKTFAFDKVFGPSSLQNDLFEQEVFSIVSEVFEHFSCTIFAYSQISIGKTYNMEGGTANAKNGEFPNDVGIIPRFVRQIYDKLEGHNFHYSMKVSFLEPYNEEIVDLLALEESMLLEDKSKKPITVIEDGAVGSVFKHPLRKFNIKAEQSARQQQKVDMYMRSTQQFKEFLAKMKFLKSCMRLLHLETRVKILAPLLKAGIKLDVFVKTNLVSMYAKFGLVDDAQQVFVDIPDKDVYIYNMTISDLAMHGRADGKIHLFGVMVWQDRTFILLRGTARLMKNHDKEALRSFEESNVKRSFCLRNAHCVVSCIGGIGLSVGGYVNSRKRKIFDPRGLIIISASISIRMMPPRSRALLTQGEYDVGTS